MGCGTSHNDVIKNVLPQSADSTTTTGGENVKKANANGATAHDKSPEILNNARSPHTLNSGNSSASEASTIPANDFYQNFSSRNMSGTLRPLPNTLPPLKPPRSSKVGYLDQNINESTEMNKNGRGVPVAFEVPAAEGEEVGSLIKKHPPRRLRRMEDQLPESLTQEVLEEKVQLANERRTQVLHQRVASARQKSARVGLGRVRSMPPLDQVGEDGFPTGSGSGGNVE